MGIEEKALEAFEQYVEDLAHNITRLECKLRDYKIEYTYAIEALNGHRKREEYKKCIAKGAGK